MAGVERQQGAIVFPESDEHRIATKADLTEAKDDIRREMKLWLGLGIAGGNALAALITSYLSNRPPLAPVEAAARQLVGLIT